MGCWLCFPWLEPSARRDGSLVNLLGSYALGQRAVLAKHAGPSLLRAKDSAA